MVEIMYKPEDAGTNVLNNRGKVVKLRKYHITDKEKVVLKKRWEKDICKVDRRIVKLAGNKFFNPYRKGIYYYQIKALFLLGTNKWHTLGDIIDKIIEEMRVIPAIVNGRNTNLWEKFKGRSSRSDAVRCKDHIGRIQENMVFFQRLSKLHPSGYKLKQVFSAVDIKRVSMDGFPLGCYYYKLSTYDNFEKAYPIRDFSSFEFIKNESKYINYNFIGTIITKDKVISKGILNEL